MTVQQSKTTISTGQFWQKLCAECRNILFRIEENNENSNDESEASGQVDN